MNPAILIRNRSKFNQDSIAAPKATDEQRSKPPEPFWLRRKRPRGVHDLDTTVLNLYVRVPLSSHASTPCGSTIELARAYPKADARERPLLAELQRCSVRGL